MSRRIALAALALGLLLAPSASAGNGIFVGAAEDAARSLDPLTAKAKMDLAALAGLGTVRMTLVWTPGEQAVGGDDLVVLRNAATAAQLDGIRLVVSIYQRDQRTTPLTSRARGEFAGYAASVARRFPSIRDFVIGNEPNLNRFWMPQFGAGGVDLAARSYELLLAKTYDALKAVSPDVDVIGGALSPRGQDKPGSLRQTHSPTAFIADLGAAYRRSGRKLPIMDMFAIHPYLIPSRLPPTFAHPSTTTLGIADYPKLVALLTRAFSGTAQHGRTLPIIYDEFGYQSQIPPAKRHLYSHLGSAAALDAIPEARQADYYRQAFAMAECQSTVAGMLIFHVSDERDARAWQSGVYYSNDAPKSSLAAVRAGALAAADGTLAQCAHAKATSTLGDVVFHEPAGTGPRTLELDFSCDLPCSYEARVLDAQTADVVAEASGKAVGEQRLTIPADTLDPGAYQYAFRVFKCGKPGTAESRSSTPFTIPPASSTLSATPLPAPPPLAPPLPTLQPTVPAATSTTGG